MIIAALMLQLGFGIAFPREGPLVPYGDCIKGAVAQTAVERLRYEEISDELEAECGRLRQLALAEAVEMAVARGARTGGALTREEVELVLPELLELAIRRAINDELRSRGIDPHPPSRRPSIPIPRDHD